MYFGGGEGRASLGPFHRAFNKTDMRVNMPGYNFRLSLDEYQKGGNSSREDWTDDLWLV